LPTYRAVDWEPFEVSVVPIGFDDGAKIRSAKTPAEYPGQRFNTQFEIREAEQAPEQPAAVATETQEETTMTHETRAAEDQSQAAIEPERKRNLTIRSMAKKVGIADEFTDDLIARGVSSHEASTAMIDKLAERQAAEQHETRTAQPTVVTSRIDASVATAKRDAMQNALLARCNPSIKLEESAREFRGMRLIDMARESIELAGGNARGMTPQEIARAALGCDRTAVRAAGMHTTSDFPILLGSTVNRTLRDAYALAPQTWRPLGRQTTVSDFREVTRVALGDIS